MKPNNVAVKFDKGDYYKEVSLIDLPGTKTSFLPFA
jgi:hypothetical protein